MSTELTPRQPDPRRAEFVRAFAESGNASEAAVAAGFVRTYGAVLLRDPHIARDVANAARQRLVRFAPRALNVLEHLAEYASSEKVRADCAKTLLDRVGLIPPKAQKDLTAVEIPLHEMTIEELRARVDRYENEIVGRAKPIEAVPEQTPGDLPPDEKPKRKRRATKPSSVVEDALKEVGE